MMGARKLIKQYLAMTMLGLTCLLTMLPANAATTTIVVNANGTATTECSGFLLFRTCNDVYATFDLYVEGVKVGSTQTTSGSYQNFTFNNVTVPSSGTYNVDVHFINDFYCSTSNCSGDRNININSVTIGSQTISPAGETIDAGNSYAQATDGVTTYSYSTGLFENSALRLSASQPAGPPYDFPNNFPPGCSGSGGTYTCNIDAQMNYDVTFSDTGNVTINHNGDYRLGAGYAVGTASQSANVTINVVDPESNTNLELYSGSNVYANFNVTTSSSSRDIQISMSGTATVHGDINASSQDNVYFDMYDNSVVNGDVNTFGTDYASVEIRSNATVNGNVVADSNTTDNGDIVFYDPGVTITGDVTAYGDITNSGTINGCVLITDTYSGARLTLNSGSSTAKICKGTVGSCDSSSTYLTNNSGSTPPDCAAAPAAAELIAEYHLDEESWDGTNNEVKDTADYAGAPFDGQGIGSPVPSAGDTEPAHAGTTGTCGYATFSGSPTGGSAFTLDNLPVSTDAGDKTSVSFWMYWDGSSPKLVVGFYSYYLLFRDGNFGFGSGAADLYGISGSSLANGWHHVVSVFSDSDVTNSKLYIDGILQTLTQRAGSPSSGNAQVTNLITLGGWGYNDGGRFNDGRIDEVKIYKGEMSQAQVTADFTATHKCLYPAPANNIAPSATLSSSNVLEGWDDIDGVNDNLTPTSSYYVYGGYDGDNPRVYANCCTNGVQDWLEFAWPTAKKLTDFQVFWWDDTVFGRAVSIPTSAFVEYWDGSAWVNVGEVGKARHQFNSLPLNNIITTKIRVTMQSAKIVGIIEVRILGEDAPELIAEYHLDEASWSGSTGEVLDSSGNGYHGNAINSATTAFSDRAIAGTNGTCAYGVFDGAGKAVVLPTTLPRLKDSVSMTFWVKRLGNPESTYSRLFVDDTGGSYGYGVKLNNDGSLNYFKRGFGSTKQNGNGVILTVGEWYFVALTVDDATDSLTFYTYDQSGTLLNTITHSGYTDTLTSYAPTGQGASIGAHRDGTNPFNGEVDELRLYSGALTQTEVDAIRQETHPCASYVSNTPASNFNCVATGADADTGHLYLQKTGTQFNVDVVALKSDRSVETTFAEASNQNVTVELVNGSGTTACAARAVLSPTVSQTVTFSAADAGRKTIPITVNKAYRDLRCRVTDANQSPTVTGCSSDHFVVKPATLTVTATSANADSNGTSPTATPVITAGGDFTITVNGGPGYDGIPAIHYAKLQAHTGAIRLGNFTGAFSAATAATGEATGTFQYREVGYIKLDPQGIYDSDSFSKVDSDNGDCAPGSDDSGGLYACDTINTDSTAFFGRFVPGRFDVLGSSLATSGQCASSDGKFTYFGYDGLTTTFTLKAETTIGELTENYDGDFAKLDLTTWNDTSAATGYRFVAANLPSGVTLSASADTPPAIGAGWVRGSATVTVKHFLSRPSTPVSPTTIDLRVDPIDEDGVKVVYANLEKISVDDDSLFRYGRLSLRNVYGSELRELSLPVEAQYWDGNTYRNNTLDSCTTVSTGDFLLSNYTENLSVGETTLAGGGLMDQGISTVTLTKPGVGNSGSVDLSLTLLNLPWFDAGAAPVAKATFGIHKTPFIYMRESF